MGGLRAVDDRMMALAARAALRGFGSVEPNPMVGCVIGREDGRVLSVGHHRRFGGRHAEAEALARAGAFGHDVRGGTAWVTLEPCAHEGKSPACAPAMAEAGLARVVIARRDPNEVASGGASVLRDAGLDVAFRGTRDLAWWAGQPFVHRITSGLPWTIAKWAQSIDGKIATASGESKWISGDPSRRRVHRLRGCVDAVLTGIGTVTHDDPMLTVRGVRARRVPVRAVIDPCLELPLASALVRSAGEIPVLAYTDQELEQSERSQVLRAAGVVVVGVASRERGMPVETVLRDLVARYDAMNVLIESGPGLLGRAFAEGVVREAMVFVAPIVMGDRGALGAVEHGVLERLRDATRLRLWRHTRAGEDAVLRYVIETGTPVSTLGSEPAHFVDRAPSGMAKEGSPHGAGVSDAGGSGRSRGGAKS